MYNLIGFTSKTNEGHDSSAEQKIRDLKNVINRFRRLSIKDKKKKKFTQLNEYKNVVAATKFIKQQ